jgi:hypothetical protein
MADGHSRRVVPWLTVLALCATFALAASPAVARAPAPTIFTKFKYKLDSGVATFRGEITSPNASCITGRKVKLLRKKNGGKDKVGSDRTNGKGKFEIDLGHGRPKSGKYIATIKETTVSSSTTCLAHTSPAVKISGG